MLFAKAVRKKTPEKQGGSKNGKEKTNAAVRATGSRWHADPGSRRHETHVGFRKEYALELVDTSGILGLRV